MNQSKDKSIQFILTFIFMVLATWAILSWYDWKLLLILVLWTAFSRLEAKL